MSKWLNDEEVLVGQGNGEAEPVTPRMRGLSAGSPRTGQSVYSPLASPRDSVPGSPRLRGLSAGSPRPGQSVYSPLASPRAREAVPGSPQAETMGKAKELFVLCDKEGKGFITKRDMQRLQAELPLSPEQLETVFESLDRESNGFLTPVEFNTGLDGLVGLENLTEPSQNQSEDTDRMDCSQDTRAVRFVNILMELGADKLFKDQQELSSLWCELQRDRPELLSVLDGVLIHAVSHLQDSIRERDSLEQALRRRESEHDEVVLSIYEEMENQIREEREKRVAQDSIEQKQRGRQLEEELKMREQGLENSLTKQRELETRIRQLSCEQANIKEQNQQLQSLNVQLQEQVERSREQLQAALGQLSLHQVSVAQKQVARQRNMMKVSSNMQKEKDSLFRQLELLRDMNKRLRDEKDAQQSQKRNPNVTKPLKKKGSIIGNYLLQDKLLKRQLSSSDELEHDKDTEVSNSSKRHQPSCRVKGENVEQVQTQTIVSPQRVFKLVFLGNSGVGKSSFIQHYCTGHFNSKISATVGIDFQMKTLTLGSTIITLQLWDTAGQERFRSITEQYYRKADGILAMYDITQSSSFAAVRAWMDSVKEKMCEGAVLMLLANKLDLADSRSREVKTEEGQRLADQHQALFYECSAKTGCNVEELMASLAGMLVSQHDRQCEDALLLTDGMAKRGCCT
ncbi:EF-hand calcium-binding domain-containing protein 4A [Anarrhichthys ocellatus]|uniref:EF-hand calcium-binding domain-containing protein 4A n=1 Tax=Anarrhichthys ocellatus TaxID=433405 RepID=UPI0012ED2CEB|nr:EF-hand calcium-binding domain-containing protein 4A [Anarrhichthys ocellatus]XP_031721198.1 EF-hand calcium-binding domain-containing protein 4A [Anarrhichthys ocellatus]